MVKKYVGKMRTIAPTYNMTVTPSMRRSNLPRFEVMPTIGEFPEPRRIPYAPSNPASEENYITQMTKNVLLANSDTGIPHEILQEIDKRIDRPSRARMWAREKKAQRDALEDIIAQGGAMDPRITLLQPSQLEALLNSEYYTASQGSRSAPPSVADTQYLSSPSGISTEDKQDDEPLSPSSIAPTVSSEYRDMLSEIDDLEDEISDLSRQASEYISLYGRPRGMSDSASEMSEDEMRPMFAPSGPASEYSSDAMEEENDRESRGRVYDEDINRAPNMDRPYNEDNEEDEEEEQMNDDDSGEDFYTPAQSEGPGMEQEQSPPRSERPDPEEKYALSEEEEKDSPAGSVSGISEEEEERIEEVLVDNTREANHIAYASTIRRHIIINAAAISTLMKDAAPDIPSDKVINTHNAILKIGYKLLVVFDLQGERASNNLYIKTYDEGFLLAAQDEARTRKYNEAKKSVSKSSQNITKNINEAIKVIKQFYPRVPSNLGDTVEKIKFIIGTFSTTCQNYNQIEELRASNEVIPDFEGLLKPTLPEQIQIPFAEVPSSLRDEPIMFQTMDEFKNAPSRVTPPRKSSRAPSQPPPSARGRKKSKSKKGRR